MSVLIVSTLEIRMLEIERRVNDWRGRAVKKNEESDQMKNSNVQQRGKNVKIIWCINNLFMR